ncbi:hypothetical protein F5B19DRAFT_480631 [Rostrohypoxylon terebratum]|nr:hypothetical protein F5B19DRAFT_480631 [Rostrohypoxylon terebratum]
MLPTGNTRARTPDSIVWRSTKARHLVSSVRFSWDRYQKLYFVDFLETVGLSFKSADITPLLIQLNLDGYEEITNTYGENVHRIIEVKVRRKIKSVADELGEERLKTVSFGPTPKTKPVAAPKTTAPTRPMTPQITSTAKAPTRNAEKLFDFNFQTRESESSYGSTDRSHHARRDSASSTTQSLRPSHPFLKMPKNKAPMPRNAPRSRSRSNSSSTPRRNSNFDPRAAPKYAFKALESFSSNQSTPPRTVKSEISDYSDPSVEFKTPSASTIRESQSRAPSVAYSVATDEISSARRSRAKRSIGRLTSILKRAESALDEVENAFDDLPDVEGGRELALTISRLRSELNGVQIDAEEVEDFAATNLKG